MSNVIYFASGSNRLGDIHGLADIEHPIGVAAPDLSEVAIKALEGLSGRGIPVFVDSGAFEEFTRQRPISDDEWQRRLDIYERLARALGDDLYVVAPDKIADQPGTLARLDRYIDRIETIRELKAHILMPIQTGELSLCAFTREVYARLGRDIVLALPMKAAATTHQQAIELIRTHRPKCVHFLGLGPESKTINIEQLIADAHTAAPGIKLMFDSCLIRRLVGRTNGPSKGPRLLSEAQDWAASEIAQWTNYGAPSGTLGFDGGDDFTESLFEPETWLRGKAREELAQTIRRLGFPAEAERFKRAPSQVLGDDDALSDALYPYLRCAWRKYFNGVTSAPERKRQAIALSIEPWAI